MLTRPKSQAKVSSPSGDCEETFGRGSAVRPPPNGEGLRGIQHNMSMVLDTRFYIWFIMTLYYEMRQISLQDATATLLQNATEVYYKMHRVFYYKIR